MLSRISLGRQRLPWTLACFRKQHGYTSTTSTTIIRASSYSTQLKEVTTNESSTASPVDAALATTAEEEQKRAVQAPNRAGIWTRSQKPRAVAMVGPRFEQMEIKDQPQPLSAMELIHKQPVSWRKERRVSCDGGGGPLGHPRIFINLDKPQICWCTYCGLPFANEHHRKHIESLPDNPYPLEPTGHAA